MNVGKTTLILLLCTAGIVAQINLRLTSAYLPSSLGDLKRMGILKPAFLLARIGLFSGLSLALTWYSYRKLGFLEMFSGTSLIYVFAIIVSYYLFHEPLTLNRIGSILLIIIGIWMYYLR